MDKLERRTAVNIGLAILLLGFVAGAAREAPQRQAGIRLAFQGSPTFQVGSLRSSLPATM